MNTLNIEEAFSSALERPVAVLAFHVSRELAGRFPESYILETECGSFDLDTFISGGNCTARERTGIHGQVLTDWYALDSGLFYNDTQLWQEIDWLGNAIEVVRMSYPSGYCNTVFYWLIAANQDVAESFFRAVCELNAVIEKEVLVFQHGY